MKSSKCKMHLNSIILFIFILLLFTTTTATAKLTGYVKNIVGTGVNDAVITVTTSAGNITTTTASDADGNDGYYSIDLNSGGYNLSILADNYIELAGYWKFKRSRDFYLSRKYFVNPDPVIGTDNGDGTENEPFLTLERARNAIRSDKENAVSPWHGAEVYLRGKTATSDIVYYRKESFVLSDEDSGTVEAPVVYKAYPGEEVRIVGGERLEWSSFTAVNNSDVLDRLDVNVQDLVRQIDLSELADKFGELKRRGIDSYFGPDLKFDPSSNTLYPPAGPMEIFIGQEPGQLARWPDKAVDSHDLTRTPGSLDETKSNIIPFQNMIDSDRPYRWISAADPWFHGFWDSNYADRYSRGTIDEDAASIHLNDMGDFDIRERFFYAKNLLEEITQPNEWYLDRASGILYIYPPENMPTEEIMVSTLGDSLLILNGASNVHFENIIFEMGRGELVSVHEDYANSHQATNNRFYNCVFRNAYYAGVSIHGTGNMLEHCTINNTGDMGVWLDGGDPVSLTEGNNEIKNSKIFKISRWRMSMVPGIRIKGVGQTLRDNDLYDLPGSAILGSGIGHDIKYNDISGVLQYGQDVAAIYLGGGYHMRGNTIQFNSIHDILPNLQGEHREVYGGPDDTTLEKTAYFSFGIYLDDVHSGATVTGNVFNNIAGAALYHGGGRDNFMENNIMVNCGTAFWTDNRGMDRVISPQACNENDTACYQALEGTYDMFLATQLNTGDFVHLTSPWAETYPKLAVMPSTWEEVRDGNWRQPEDNTFKRNLGVIEYGKDSIFYFAKNEKVHPYQLATLERPLRDFTYPLNYFADIESIRQPYESLEDFSERVFLEFINVQNDFSHDTINLAPASGIISITGSGFFFDDIPIGEAGTDW